MKISRKGIDLITRWEGCKLTAYKDGGGVWTIGYGHTSAAGEPKVKAGLTITAQDARDIFTRDIVKYELAVLRVLKKLPTQAQFDAMVSLCYNIGPDAFARSTVVRRFNAGDVAGAADAFNLWVKDNGRIIQGLVNRRADEIRHFRLTISDAPVQPPPVVPEAPAAPKAPEPVPAAPAPSRGLWAAILDLLKSLFSKSAA